MNRTGYEAAPTISLADFETQFPSVYKPLRIKAPPKISPSKRAFEKYKPQGLFSEFYGNYLAYEFTAHYACRNTEMNLTEIYNYQEGPQ